MDLETLLSELSASFDAEGWWRSDSPLETAVGAFLIQRTTWESIVPVLEALKRRGLMDTRALASVELAELEGILRPSGFYRQKAKRVKGFAIHVLREHGGDLEALLRKDVDEAREELLGLEGVGPETADAILLFAGNRPRFVAAAYARRVLARTGVLESDDYHEVQAFVESRLPRDATVYRRLYASIVQLAKGHCLAKPVCQGCPLSPQCRSSP